MKNKNKVDKYSYKDILDKWKIDYMNKRGVSTVEYKEKGFCGCWLIPDFGVEIVEIVNDSYWYLF